jgi:hypothetical protein
VVEDLSREETIMAVGGIRGGGRGPKGAKRASAKGGAGKSSGATFGKVDSSEGLAGPSGAAGSGEVGAPDPVSMHALAIAKALKAGQIASKSEAAQQLVSGILKQRLRIESKALSKKISDHLQDDPYLKQALERIWAKS